MLMAGCIQTACYARCSQTYRWFRLWPRTTVVGTIQPIEELAQLTKLHGALFHTDAVQAGGKIPLDVNRLRIDLLSLSAHKLHGPKGVGALYTGKGVKLSPIVFGGGQERGLRSATENVAGIRRIRSRGSDRS